MKESLFHEQMSSREARSVLFHAIEGKSDEEAEKLITDYLSILPTILERESQLALDGWFID